MSRKQCIRYKDLSALQESSILTCLYLWNYNPEVVRVGIFTNFYILNADKELYELAMEMALIECGTLDKYVKEIKW